MPETQDQLAALRQNIDAVDAVLLDALNRRAALSLEMGRLKAGIDAPVFSPEREITLLDRLAAANPGPLPREHLQAIYKEILASSRSLQNRAGG